MKSLIRILVLAAAAGGLAVSASIYRAEPVLAYPSVLCQFRVRYPQANGSKLTDPPTPLSCPAPVSTPTARSRATARDGDIDEPLDLRAPVPRPSPADRPGGGIPPERDPDQIDLALRALEGHVAGGPPFIDPIGTLDSDGDGVSNIVEIRDRRRSPATRTTGRARATPSRARPWCWPILLPPCSARSRSRPRSIPSHR